MRFLGYLFASGALIVGFAWAMGLSHAHVPYEHWLLVAAVLGGIFVFALVEIAVLLRYMGK